MKSLLIQIEEKSIELKPRTSAISVEYTAMNPYVAGGLSGLLAIASVWIGGEYLGASTTFAKSAGMLEKVFSPEHVSSLSYFQKYVPAIDWQWMFVAGILIGAFIAAWYTKTFKWTAVPKVWKERFGNNWVRRAGVAVIGGVIAIFGARLAGGCPSGHGLSGTMQLAASGFVALVAFFLGGSVMAHFIYKK